MHARDPLLDTYRILRRAHLRERRALIRFAFLAWIAVSSIGAIICGYGGGSLPQSLPHIFSD